MKFLKISLLFFSWLLTFSGAQAQILKAGAAQVNITPVLGTALMGDFSTHYAQAIHDSVYVKALVLDNGKKIIALVVTDVCEMNKELTDEVKNQITKQTSLTPAQVMVASTHTHSSAAPESYFLSAADIPFRSKLPEQAAAAVLKALHNRRPAKISFASVPIPDYVHSRRWKVKPNFENINPVTGAQNLVKTWPPIASPAIIEAAATPDPEFSFMAVRELNGNWISVLGNYSTHYVGDLPANTISADYFGEFGRQLQEKLKTAARFVGILSNGTSGDVNTINYLKEEHYSTETFGKTRLIAGDLADAVLKSLKKIKWTENPELDFSYRELKLGLRKPSAQEITTATQRIAKTNYETPTDWFNGENLKNIYALEQVKVAQMPDSVFFPVQAIRIGNQLIGAMAGEMFSETGLWLKANKPKGYAYFSIGLANGCLGYVPTAKDIEWGGYETWRCRTSCLETDAESIIRQSLIQLVKNVAGH